MTGPERVPRMEVRHNPVGNFVFNQHPIPGAQKQPKKRDNAPQPPRPQNAWILYRAWALSTLLERQPELKGTPQSQLSKILGAQWASETPEVRKHFEHQANLNKERHAQAFPDYVFKPQKKEEKEREREKKKQERARTRETEKMRKEIERDMHAGYLPRTMNSIPTPEALHRLAVLQFKDTASPPLSQCPSPVMTNSSVDDEAYNRAAFDGTEMPTGDANPVDGVSVDCAPTTVTSGATSNAYNGGADQQNAPFLPSTEVPPHPNNSMSLDKAMASRTISDAPIGWSQFASTSMTDINAFIKHAFPPSVPDPEPNRFEMPPGNIVIRPGFVDNTQQSNSFDISGLISIPLGDQDGILDDQHDCDLSNPHTEQGSSSGVYNSAAQPANEAFFMEPFVQMDVSLEHLLAAGKEVGDALLDEQEASANGERVVAAEHVQSSAPAASVVKPGASSFLPSPPESSSSATSPRAPGLFDFGATNLSASGSNRREFGGPEFSDTMSNMDLGSSAWSLPLFGDLGGQDGFDFGSSKDPFSGVAQLSTNLGDCGSSVGSGGLFSSVPPTPVSAGAWLGGGFDIGEITMSDFSSATSNSGTSSTDDAQLQKEIAWFASCFNEAGSGPV